MNGWGPSDDGFATRQATIDDGIAFARQALITAKTRPSRMECEDCEEPIPEARRAAVPGVRFCVECQTSHDKIVHASYNRRGSKDSQLR
ncbi:putative C4-type zinc finger protein [Serratia phage Muldoon]|uniref:Putative C4-type zinc finger protein n=1 Tax=Serratia phage Muldoon TaxID=2601678 RepID=A0A5P8PH48_9CAUD|nr:DksA-like zinc-finger protein [Serratia phage Muldoon]QFR56048.1 putative C4-type zinc finger protein [Serratia phage Muldoon]